MTHICVKTMFGDQMMVASSGCRSIRQRLGQSDGNTPHVPTMVTFTSLVVGEINILMMFGDQLTA
jgi:hypothetical protein